ncbi:MAG TPA: hypothetical protein VK145_02545 [Candidatus Nanoarchaeia archaeon]|nr:hypothetical protein [Candidatus Nanoarchaeia archaeon]
MQFVLLVPEYFIWHYTSAVRLTINIISNFLWFVYHFFSVPILIKTLITPIHGVGKGFAVPSQVIGFVVRLAAIFFAYTILAISVLFGILVVILWLLLPFIVMYLIVTGLKLILL